MGFSDKAAEAMISMTKATIDHPEMPKDAQRGKETIQEYIDRFAAASH